MPCVVHQATFTSGAPPVHPHPPPRVEPVCTASAATKINDQDLVKQYGKDLRLSNFTATEMRRSKLEGADLRGAYLIKVPCVKC